MGMDNACCCYWYGPLLAHSPLATTTDRLKSDYRIDHGRWRWWIGAGDSKSCIWAILTAGCKFRGRPRAHTHTHTHRSLVASSSISWGWLHYTLHRPDFTTNPITSHARRPSHSSPLPHHNIFGLLCRRTWVWTVLGAAAATGLFLAHSSLTPTTDRPTRAYLITVDGDGGLVMATPNRASWRS